MTVTVLRAGVQTSVQAGSRRGFRHIGVPAAGAADTLSLALANRLVGNNWDAAALEITAVGPALRFQRHTAVAVAGAPFELRLNGKPCKLHRTTVVSAGDVIDIGSTPVGLRAYLSVAGGFRVQQVLGSASTYMTGSFGGLEGRALDNDDVLEFSGDGQVDIAETPDRFLPSFGHSWSLRTCASCETGMLDKGARSRLFGDKWTVSRRADRMGMQLEGPALPIRSDGRMPSAGVFPGTIQCTESGSPYLLAADSGTTGGYPRIAQVARCDRHLVGQMRPGDSMLLLERTVDDANAELAAKADYWQPWLPSIRDIL